MAPIYIDEATGNDEAGDGTQNAPYKTLAYALAQHDAEAANQLELLVRKDGGAPYDKPSDSSLKKAKKGADGLRKKAAKAAEVAAREAKERADQEKKIEESKKIVLVEDESLPKAKRVRRAFLRATSEMKLIVALKFGQAKINKLESLRGQRVRVSGWVHRLRQQKGLIFVVLRDGTGQLQAVLSGRCVGCFATFYHAYSQHTNQDILYRHKHMMR